MQDSTVHAVETLLFFTLLELIVIVGAARLFGWMARRVGQPRVIGEVVAGLVLGPSLFGALAPETFNYVFKSTDAVTVSIISQLGLIFLMLQVGMEFEFGVLRERRSRTAAAFVSIAGIVAPFVLGVLIGYISAPVLAPRSAAIGYILFCGVALSITAMPVLGRIMIELDLTRTWVGAITISAAAVNDVVGWLLLAVVSAAVAGNLSPGGTSMRVLALAAYVAFAFLVLRPLLRRLLDRTSTAPEPLTLNGLALVLMFAFASAIATFMIGIFAIFGGFMIGVLLHDRRAFVNAWRQRVAPLVNTLFLPVFFTFTGLRTNLSGLDSGELWLWCAAFILLAYLGKYGGCYVGARLAGVTKDEARTMAIMMNTRGLMELVVLNVGYDLGVIPQNVFTMLVLMAVVTSVTTAPLLRVWMPRLGHVIPAGHDA
ncbi:MAG TPA: cation:proton antiporter [Burkholderiaceae bacterium]|nr:cation:proton antiporter [Burkholderiaceae bacterium]